MIAITMSGAMGRIDLASGLTIHCHTGICFYGHHRWYNYHVWNSILVQNLPEWRSV